MTTVVAPASPCSPPRKKTKFSLRLKGKKKSKQEAEGDYTDSMPSKLYPIFRSPVQSNTTPLKADTVTPPHYAGLMNRGNICFANAVVQVLRCCPGFEQFMVNLSTRIKVIEDISDEDEFGEGVPAMICELDKLLFQIRTIEKDYIENKENCAHLSNGGGSVLVLAAEPSDFMEAFRQVHPTFQTHLQHDAQEFLRTLIITLQESSKEMESKMSSSHRKLLKKNKSTDGKVAERQLGANAHKKSAKVGRSALSNSEKEVPPDEYCCIEEVFQGKLVHQTKCLNCEDAKLRMEDFQDISVPVQEDQQYKDARKMLKLSPTPKKNKAIKKHTLEWAISQFATVECLKDNNKYFCEGCATYTEAEISTCFEQLPMVFTIHLKRFTTMFTGSSAGYVSKIMCNLETPLKLSVMEWCSKKCSHQTTTYELFGIVIHSGMTSCSGHYEAYVKVLCDERKQSKKQYMVNGGTDNSNLSNSMTSSKGEESPLQNSKGSDRKKRKDDKNDENNAFDSKYSNEKETTAKDECCGASNNLETTGDKTNTITNSTSIGKSIRKSSRRSLKGIAKVRIAPGDNPPSPSTDDELTNSKATKKARLKSPFSGSRLGIDTGLISQSPDTENNSEKSEQTSCMFGLTSITKYFHKSRKTSSKEPKVEGVPNETEQTEGSSSTNENSDGKVEHPPAHYTKEKTSSSSFIVDKNVSSTSDYSKSLNSSLTKLRAFQRNATNPKSPAIRQLTFQHSDNGLTCGRENGCRDTNLTLQTERCSDPTTQCAEPNRSKNKVCKEPITEWIHFDDSEVHILDDADVVSLLSSSETSFTSPYLLFYRRLERLPGI